MENKHNAWDLKQMQALSLDAKIRMTQDRIRGWYDNYDGNVYVCVSGGKDSQVLAHIVKGMYPDVPCVFTNTGLEYNSVRQKGIELADEVLRPEMNFAEVIKKYGYPVISKEVSECVQGAKKYLIRILEENNNLKTDRQTDNLTLTGIEGLKVKENTPNFLHPSLRSTKQPFQKIVGGVRQKVSQITRNWRIC